MTFDFVQLFSELHCVEEKILFLSYVKKPSFLKDGFLTTFLYKTRQLSN